MLPDRSLWLTRRAGNAIYLDVVRHDRTVVNVHDMIPYLAAVDRLEGFRAETGEPMILNTSFNENEPVVCRPKEAIDCFLRTKMDVLVLGKRAVSRGDDAVGGLRHRCAS